MFGAILGAAATLGSSLMSKKSASDQMDFQSDMYGKRYQMQMDDMRKAGLNPILSYGQSPPGSPAGASYKAGDMASGALAGASSALSSSKKKTEDKVRDEQVRQISNQADAAAAQAVKTGEETKNVQANRMLLGQQYETGLADVSSAKHLNDFYQTDTGRAAIRSSKYPSISNVAGTLHTGGNLVHDLYKKYLGPLWDRNNPSPGVKPRLKKKRPRKPARYPKSSPRRQIR